MSNNNNSNKQTQFLNNAYELQNKDQTRALYDQWAGSYDEELINNGYASPQRTAHALAEVVKDKNLPLLDIGCGTGYSGELLHQYGFSQLFGSDFSQAMLDAAAQKELYKKLYLADLDAPFDYIHEGFPIMSAVGVFAPGHATAQALSTLLDLMPINGVFGFSINEHALQDPAYLEQINTRVFSKTLRIRWQDYGDHVPGIQHHSLIFAVERIA